VTTRADVELGAPVPALARTRGADFFELTKPRITLLVLITMVVGFYLGNAGTLPWPLLVHALVGTGLVAAGASVGNMWLERHLDARMERTSTRPLPARRVRPGEASLFAVGLSLAGLLLLVWQVNLLAAGLAAVTLLSYLLVYTPLKTRTWLCTPIGAVPGAVPPMIGWAAATGGLGAGAWLLFGVLFLWQLPHFYAIAWLYRDDYARAGFPMLPVIDATGNRTGRQVGAYLVALLLFSLLPFALRLAGPVYGAGALVLGTAFLAFGIRFVRLRDRASARGLFVFSVCYLPLLLGLLVSDKAA
jgi:protoheme IX farnesyltransferase